jgi:hypothetical protein
VSTLRVSAPDIITAIGLAERVKPLASTVSCGGLEIDVSIEIGRTPLKHALKSLEGWLEAYQLESTVIELGGKSYSLERPILGYRVGTAADLDAVLAA